MLILTVSTVAGLAIYRAALADPVINHITLLTRRPVPSWASPPPDAANKTTTILHNNFLSYPQEVARRLAENDACIWALGKTSSGMNEQEYTKITHGYTLAAAQALKDASAGDGEGRSAQKPFRFVFIVFISSELADPAAASYMPMFTRVKGKTEKDLADLCNGAQHMKVHILRPGYFFPSTQYPEDRRNQRPRGDVFLDAFL
ncbi:uncharacterized protein FIBRA_06154 [Fibroporia radiculosa]|uniref:NAD(P)-binding domain-containing protein n=1 Tax=Fibroporia radiculosa TaxID=599839 RepID=J4HYN6_9APHY|nr:uncharacterized protein FIBRA_06154 [Fibroporia radiculosa]CCM03997.1 predicted protein [Fibroporia radiculosa]